MASKKPINVFAQATKLKVSTTITGLDENIDTAGEAVNLTLEVCGQKLAVPLNPKSFRKVQAAIKAGEPGTVIVILTGELDLQAKRITSAGIVPQVKTPKPDSGAQVDIAPETIVQASPPIVSV